jgi:DNA-binding NarL/FixJ family response regulator
MDTRPASIPSPRQGFGLTLLLVDGHRLIGESVARMLPQLEPVRTATFATSLSQARDVLDRGGIDIVLVDDIVDHESGLDLLEHTPRSGRHAHIAVFSATTEPTRVAEALRHGAAGWIVKDCGHEELVEALTTIRSGRRWVSPRLRADVIHALVQPVDTGAQQTSSVTLSPRQREVLSCLVAGMSHGETAEQLGLSLSTVRTHVRHMCAMLDVHSTPALVAVARAGRLALLADTAATRPR